MSTMAPVKTARLGRKGHAIRRVGGALAQGARMLILPVIVLVVLVVVWWLIVINFGIAQYLLPTPGDVWHSLWSNTGILGDSLMETGKEVVVGFLVSGAIAVPLGIALGESRVLQAILYPLMVMAQLTPKVAFAPLMIVWFGLGLTSKIIFIFLVSFFAIIINTMVGVTSASSDFRRLADSVGLGRFATLWKVTLPQALPNIFTGLKIGMTLAVIGAVVAEFVSAQSGLGFLILTAQGQVDTPLLFASILVLTAMGLVLYGIVAVLEWLAMPWQRRARS
ncbi:MAG: ABC transporter permease [Streptosporangiaceae bacterium]